MTDRLTKKCMMASTGLHTLLILVLFVGPAFFSKPPDQMDSVIIVGNFTVTDDKGLPGGGNPSVTEPPPAAAPQNPPQAAPPPPAPKDPEPPKTVAKQDAEPEPEPPKPQPREESRPEPKPEPKPEKTEPVKTKDPDAIPEVKKPTKPEPKKVDTKSLFTPVDKNKSKTTAKTSESKPKQEFAMSKVTGRKIAPSASSTTSSADSARAAQAAADARHASLTRQLGQTVGSLSSRIGNSAASSTSVEMPGPGGEAFVSYGQIVRDAFERAWRDPSEVSDNSANVKVQVVVDRSGSVESARIVNRSGIAAMDKSVQEALNRVRTVGSAFPAGSRDRQRTFIINFNLKTRRLTG